LVLLAGPLRLPNGYLSLAFAFFCAFSWGGDL
jgi:hypothetical protein